MECGEGASPPSRLEEGFRGKTLPDCFKLSALQMIIWVHSRASLMVNTPLQEIVLQSLFYVLAIYGAN